MTKLQERRVKKGYSQAELAEITGIEKRTIQGYECNHRSIDGAKIKTLLILSKALDCNISEILEDQETAKELREFNL